MAISRRSFLGVLGGVGANLTSVGDRVSSTGFNIFKRHGTGSIISHEDRKKKKFIDFNSFWKACSRRARRSAQYVHYIDPDLAGMKSISLWKKMDMQRDRNYRYIKEEWKSDFFKEIMSSGSVEVYTESDGTWNYD